MSKLHNRESNKGTCGEFMGIITGSHLQRAGHRVKGRNSTFLIQWKAQSTVDAIWMDTIDIHEQFSCFRLEGKAGFKAAGNVMNLGQELKDCSSSSSQRSCA